MYELDCGLGDVTVEPGTNVLVTGPPLVGKRKVAFDILATGSNENESMIIVSTRESADRLLRTYRTLLEKPSGARIGTVDAVTRHMGKAPAEGDYDVTYCSSPGDLTEIGIKFSEFIQSYYTEQGIERNRVLLDSLTTLLMYAKLQTVFRFVHVFTSRVKSADALGIYTIESTAHDEETLNTLRQLFDEIIRVGTDGTISTTFDDESRERITSGV